MFIVKLHSEKMNMKNNKGQYLKNMKERVIILVHCSPPKWDMSTYEVSSWYLKDFQTKCTYEKLEKGNN